MASLPIADSRGAFGVQWASAAGGHWYWRADWCRQGRRISSITDTPVCEAGEGKGLGSGHNRQCMLRGHVPERLGLDGGTRRDPPALKLKGPR